MGRHRQYADPAERQKAYRLRVEAQQREAAAREGAILNVNQRRPPSRPTRIAALETATEALLDDYRGWLEALPEGPLQEGIIAEKLSDTIEALETILELIQRLDPPKGFGRD